MRRIAERFFVNCILVSTLWSAQFAWAGDGISRFGDAAATYGTGLSTSGQAVYDPNQPSKPGFETLRGNGAMGGYVLGHGGIVPKSESVTVGGSLKSRDRDYVVDYTNGTIVFTQPVRVSEAARVSYRYYTKAPAARILATVPSLSLVDSNNIGMDFTYAYRAAGADGGFDLATYGVRTIRSFSKGTAIKSMMYFSAPQQGTERVDDLAPLQKAAPKKESKESLTGRFMIHEGSFGGERLKLNFAYQDISSGFSGFQALRDAKVEPTAILNQLEKEKGLRRMNVGLAFASGSGGGNLGMGEIQDGSGSLSTKSFNFTFNRGDFSYESRGMDKTFARLNNLSAQEKDSMALSILRQFNPKATAKQITENDRKRIAQEAGLRRDSQRLNLTAGKDMALAVQSFSVGDENGAISRRAISFTGENAKFFLMTQDIDKGFGKIKNLADVEKKEFGNEVGMRRMNFGGSYKAGSLQTELFSSKVSDGSASISRRQLAIAGKSFKVKANFTDIDSNFTRIADLADPDRKTLEGYVGYKKTDLTGSFAFNKNLALDAFYLTAHNAAEQRQRNQLMTNLVYTHSSGMKFAWFRDSYSSTSPTGIISGYRRQTFNIERKFGKLAFANAIQDVCEKVEVDGVPITAIVRKYHLDAGKDRKLSLVYDYKGQDFGTGKFENLTDYTADYKPLANLSFKTTFHELDKGVDPSEEVRSHSLKWEIRKDLTFSADLMERSTNNNNDGGATSLSLSGPITDRLGPFTDVKIAAEYRREDKNGISQEGGESLKFEANVLKGSLIAEYGGIISSPTSHVANSGIAFISDRDGKKPYHFNFACKSREVTPGKRIIVRNYGLDAKLNDKTLLTYVQKSNGDAADGTLEPLGMEEMKLTTALSKDLSFVCGFKKQRDYAKRLGTYLMDAGISGKLSNGASLELGFGINRNIAPTGGGHGNSFRLKYDRQVSADNFLSLEAQATKWTGVLQPGQIGTDILVRLDFKRVFDL